MCLKTPVQLAAHEWIAQASRELWYRKDNQKNPTQEWIPKLQCKKNSTSAQDKTCKLDWSILRTIWMENLHPDCLTKCIPRSDKMKLELELFVHKDLKPIENLWVELKTKLHASRPSNLEELERFSKEEWADCSGDVCETCWKLKENCRLLSKACYQSRFW